MIMLLFQVVDTLKTFLIHMSNSCLTISENIKNKWKPSNAVAVYWDGKLMTTLGTKYQIENRDVAQMNLITCIR